MLERAELKGVHMADLYNPIPNAYNTANQFPAYNSGFAGNRVCMGANTCRLEVEGKGTVSAEPDKAVVVLGVITQNIQLETAQRENADTVTAVIAAVMGQGVPRQSIQTQTYNIQPVYDYIDGKSVFRGYMVTHNLRVDIRNIGSVGAVVDAAVGAGANNVSSVEFTVSDPSQYYKEALEAAINDAIGKAEIIGAKLNVYVYPVPVHITEERYQQAVPVPYTMQATGQTTPIQPGLIEITAAIVAIFSYICR